VITRESELAREEVRTSSASPAAGSPPSRASSLPQKIALSVGAGLARELGGTVFQAHRVMVLRGQASLQQKIALSVGAGLARELGGTVFQAHRVMVLREQARSHRKSHFPLELGLPANWSARFFRHTA